MNPTLARLPHLAAFLGAERRAVIGWGRKASGRRAQVLARCLRRPCLLLEDGFLRSIGRGDAPLSLLVDDRGVYYDARAPSAVQAAIAAGTTPDQAARALALGALWRAGGLSKYNHAPDYALPLPHPYVLVADQVAGDLSVAGGLADASAFARMLAAALAEHPDCTVVVKVHPDVVSRGRSGWLAAAQWAHPDVRARVRVIGCGCHPARLIAGARCVYTVTSLIGFEALVWRRPLRCFGMPFYAGWGLSVDEMAPPPARHPASLADLIHGAFVAVARYVDPASGGAIPPEAAFAHAMAARRGMMA